MDIWMKRGSEFEHEAFLTLWLSRYVLPAQADGVINKGVFPIAILLARGTKISLAPAILASIYKDLRLLKEKIVWLRELGDQVDGGSVSRLCLSSPLQLLQVWIWERFTTLSPKPNFVTDGIRLQKWHKVANPKNNDVGLAFDAAMESFRWRPYTTSLSNGSICDKLYVEEASWVSVNSDVSIDLESYARIVRNSKLVGLNCVEQYLPHRVSMQFGLDQDIPCVFPRVSDTRNLAWNDYNRPVGDVKMYIPSRLFKSDVTMSYLEWWKDLEDVKDNVKCLRKRKDAKTNSKPCQESSKISMLVPPGFSPKSEGVAMSDCFDQLEPCSKRSQVTPCCPETVIEISESETCSALFSKGMKSDEEPDDDCLTLTELFGVESTQKESRSEALSVNRRERPQSSAADNALIQKITLAKENSENSLPSLECTREELIIEEKNESKVECQFTTPISTEVNKTQTTFNGTPECPDSPETPKMDILDRIARLQRIFDIYKSAKVGLI
uniref:Aminotransferase-like plant mobile domain-containing protein n=2 Tax=Chenopodium quinoa TaxID=63459 RepID=A0A803LYC6_CHEQI